MLPDCYFGAYARFDTTSKKDAAILLGSNCIIGDVFNIEFKPLEGQTRAWVVNDYGDTLGYLDEQTSHKLNLLAAKNCRSSPSPISRNRVSIGAKSQSSATTRYINRISILLCKQP